MRVKDIDVTLSDGQYLTGFRCAVIYVSLFLCLLLVCLANIFPMIYINDLQQQGIWIMVLSNILFISYGIVLIYLLHKNRTLAKEISKWLEDAQEATAVSRLVGEHYMGMQPKVGKIEITFWLDGKRYVRESTAKGWGGQKGYMACFRKYAERNVRILYSAKYDKVMIPKDQTCISSKE